MKSTDDRKLFGSPIGASAASSDIATIPQTQSAAGDGTASVALGFPPETFIARAAGGVPPRGQDMNGLLNLLSSAIQVLQTGYLGPFDATFAQSIGGYPAGAIVCGGTPGAFWVSTADANVSTPGADGATWQSLFNGYATQAWSNSLFATIASLNSEASTRASADAALQNQINNRVQKTGDMVDWLQVVGGFWVLGNECAVYNSVPNSWLNLYVDNNNCATVDLNGGSPADNTGNTNWFRLHPDGTLYTGNGTVAFESDLANYVSLATYNSDFGTSDSRVINLAYGFRIQVFTVTVADQAWVTFPVSFSSAPLHINIEVNQNIDCDHAFTGQTASGFEVHLWSSATVTLTIMAIGMK